MTETLENLSLKAESIIREGIIRGSFAFGERLSDRALAARLGISRTPVREALARLAKEDLVVIRPQSGSFVMTLRAEGVRAVCQMRAILECGALRLAAGNDPEQLAAAVALPLAGGALAVEEGDLRRAAELDSVFHQAIIAAADNQLLIRAYRGIADQVEAIRHRLPLDAARMKQAAAQHRRILDLAITGRLPEAEAELATHVQIVQSLTVSILNVREQS
jgi:DNA-binding GntR family transcriptional regulator